MYLESEFKDDIENIFVGLHVLLYHHLYLHGGGGGARAVSSLVMRSAMPGNLWCLGKERAWVDG